MNTQEQEAQAKASAQAEADAAHERYTIALAEAQHWLDEWKYYGALARSIN